MRNSPSMTCLLERARPLRRSCCSGRARSVHRTGNSGWSIGAPAGSSSARPGNGGDVAHGRGAWTMSSPRKRTDSTRRRLGPATPPAACSVSMWKNTASPGLELPAEDRKSSGSAVDVGQLGERALGEPLRLVVEERAGHVPLAAVRAGDELERRRPRHRVDREPHAGVLPAVDVVVRLVLVPRRALAGAGLLDQHVVVVQPHGPRAHQLGGDRRPTPDSRMKRSHRRQPLPVAEVLDERAVVVGAGPLGAAARGRRGWPRSPPRPARRARRRRRRARTPRRRAGSRPRSSSPFCRDFAAIDLALTLQSEPSLAHREADAALGGDLDGAVVAGVGVADDAGAGVGGQHPLELLGGEVGAVGDGDHPGVDRAADADAAAVVDRHPRRARTTC